ncbi:hypothetical protein VKT23_017339 [Stygiomarasmius scandens]|uniref:BZIP domain-containing protein n=1 Tax=Marasmiellus scandens TaxID=2682957 RepID=A0ABR1IW62_9AGAR
MLVDNPISNNNPLSYPDLSDFLNTDLLFAPVSSTTPGSPGASGSASTSSRASSPSILSTPPQEPPQNSFPPDVAVQDPFSFLGAPSSSGFFNFLDDELKMDPGMSTSMLGMNPYDFLAAAGASSDVDALSALFQPVASTSASTSSSSSQPQSAPTHMAIDPQLVDSPSPSVQTEEEMPDVSSATSTASKREPEEKLTLTIAPVKVGGHGKARKGTVQSGGITKKVPSPSALSATSSTASVPAPVPSSKNKENHSSKKSFSDKGDDDRDDDDDLPADWRPPPEVFAKMTSKEKRQLRNKISARNFRVRRKEYITTLETDIAERDRLLEAIRSELGTTRSENLALRQEITALKKALLGGRSQTLSPSSPHSASSSLLTPASSPSASLRGPDINLNSTAASALDELNLPPPAPLPERSAAEELAVRAAAANAAASPASASSSNLLTPNTQKDLPTSPRLGGSSFWGGVSQAGFGQPSFSSFGSLGGGYTPVHRVLVPDLSASVGQWVRDVVAANAAQQQAQQGAIQTDRKLQENMNPVLNNATNSGSENGNANAGGFDGFADSNLFTMKTLDAYRMQLWTKMATQHQQQPNQTPSPQSHLPSPHHSPQLPSHSPSQHKEFQREFSPSPFTLPTHQNPAYTSPYHSSNSLNGLASSLKPAYFKSPSPSSYSRPITGNTLSALLAGKHSGSGAGAYPSPPNSPNLGGGKKPSFVKGQQSQAQQQQQQQREREQMQQHMFAAAIATTASQTLLGKLGSAFWDAFSGGSHGAASSSNAPHGVGSSSSSPSAAQNKNWDADKVRKVLEGKAVVRVVDVEPETPKMTPKVPVVQVKKEDTCGDCSVSSLLEESMRSLTLGKK